MLKQNVEQIALDYLAITGAKDLKELKEKHEYYYGKFIEEKNRVNNKKIKVTIAEITSKTEELLEKNILKIYCQDCKRELFRYCNKVYLVPEEIQFIRKDDTLKTKCTCGKVEQFKKLENTIEIAEESEK